MIACAVCVALWGPAAHSADLMQVYEQATRNDPFIQEAERAPSRGAGGQAAGPRRAVPAGRRRRLGRNHRTGRQRHLPAGRGGRTRRPSPRLAIVNVDQRLSADSLAMAGRPAPDGVPLGPVAAPQPGGPRVARPRRSIAPPSRTSWCGSPSAISTCWRPPRRCAPRRRRSTPSLKQLREAERRFEVGVVTVIDVEEARSARDLRHGQRDRSQAGAGGQRRAAHRAHRRAVPRALAPDDRPAGVGSRAARRAGLGGRCARAEPGP